MQHPMPLNEAVRLAAVSEIDIEDALHSSPMAALVNLGRVLLDSPVVAINLIDADWQRVLSSSGMAEHMFARSISVCAHTIMGNDIFVVPDLTEDARFAGMPYTTHAPFFRFYVGIPLAREPGLNLGSLCAFDTRLRPFTPAQHAHLQDLGTLATSLLRLQRANTLLRANERLLRSAASTDPLTGALNRAGLSEAVEGLFERASDPDYGAALIFVDVDHFKGINDRFGHPAGDAVLQEVASRMAATLRNGDLLARIGGDEFCVVLRDVRGLAGLEQMTARLVAAFGKPITAEGAVIPCSISVGAAIAPVHARSYDGVAKQADAALYKAKQAGRGRFSIAA